MDFDDALAVFGLDRTADWPTVRRAYRNAMRVAHPDAGSGDAGRARLLNHAFAVVEPVFRRGVPPPPPSPSPAASSADIDPTEVVDVRDMNDDGLTLVAPAGEAFVWLLEALHEVGQVTFADPVNGYLEGLIDHGTGLLSISLQGRNAGTEAFFTLESQGSHNAPPIRTVVRALADRLRARA